MKVAMTLECAGCDYTEDILVDQGGYLAWLSGTVIQNALPDLTPDQRELMISKTCGSCWDEMFGES